MFRPELIDLGSRPASARVSLYIAAFFTTAEFGAVLVCCVLALTRKHLDVSDLRILLLPLIVYDAVTIVVSSFMLRRHMDMLLPSERIRREFQLCSLFLRSVTLGFVCLTTVGMHSLLRGFLLILAFGGSYLLLYYLNQRGPKSTWIWIKLQVWDLPILISVIQVWLRMDHYNLWPWGIAFWPIYLLATMAGLVGLMGSMSANTGAFRKLFQATGVGAVLTYWMLHALAELLEGRGTTQNFTIPLFLMALLFFVVSIGAAVSYVSQQLDAQNNYVALDENAPIGPPLRLDESVFLETVSASFYKTASDLPSVITDWFGRGDHARECEELQDLTVRPFNFDTCTICCDHEADAVFLHCGHGGVCHQCATFLFHRSGECCICRSGVQGVAKITHKNAVEEPKAEPDASPKGDESPTPRTFVKATTLMAR